MPIDNINLEFEVNEVSQDEVEENKKQGNEEIQNNGEFSGVEFDQIFDFNEINEISININSSKGVIDIGSNGIRFGLVSSLNRHLPILYEERAPISLFEAQHSSKSEEKSNIPENIIRNVENTMKRFNYMCTSYGVKIDDVTIVATEATRTAPNSIEFCERIEKSFQKPVLILDKEKEAIVSGNGIAATYNGVEGLVMDMGGGSVELSYLKFDRKTAEFKISDAPINLPYGAAALTKLLKQNNTPEKLSKLSNQIVEDLKKGFVNLGAPEDIKVNGKFTVYMSGGGFRSLGYLCMSESESDSGSKYSYPIPIINGFFTSSEKLKKVIEPLTPSEQIEFKTSPEAIFPNGNPFRISNRRAKLMPACCFLINAIMKCIDIGDIYFCEGGVRQGMCFQMMDKEIQKLDPLETFIETHPLQTEHIKHNTCQVLDILKSSIPEKFYEILDSDVTGNNKPERLERLLPSIISLSQWSMNLAKEARPISGFTLPLAGGPLCNTPGLTHVDRAIISWCLMYRYFDDANGDVEKNISVMEPSLYMGIKNMIPGGKNGRKVCEFIGKLLGFIILCAPVTKPVTDPTGCSVSQLIKIKLKKPVHTYENFIAETIKVSFPDSDKLFLVENPLVENFSDSINNFNYTFEFNRKNQNLIVAASSNKNNQKFCKEQ
ncbi:15227_t:CDS:2 [Entrophospora sp. SA101]|nr:2679_t:CDS:2 [Entrophospora sp. SA101]CAJ0849289.1 15227_t:CDS:2 [Entrophospora sp. SA101]